MILFIWSWGFQGNPLPPGTPLYLVTLSIGGSSVLIQDVIYSLPALRVRIQSTRELEGSVDGTTWSTLTGSNTTGIYTACVFIRCITGDATVSIRRR